MEANTKQTEEAEDTKQTVPKRFSTISDFCERNDVARSTVYLEHHRGRLKIKKIGRKSVIHIDDEAAWLNNLALVPTASREQS